MTDLSPREIVSELDRYIVGQGKAKRAVAIALRNRWRRQQVDEPMRSEITPKNILMIGPTGVGKTEIARRLAKLADAPFIKVEATKFTEVGYVGKDVDSIIRDLVEMAIKQERETAMRDFLVASGWGNAVVTPLPGDAFVVRAPDPLLPGPARLGCQLRPGDAGGSHLDLLVDGRVVATAASAIGLPLAWQHGGTSITLGYDRGLPVAEDYTPPFPWNGALHQVEIDAGVYEPPPDDIVRIALQVD